MLRHALITGEQPQLFLLSAGQNRHRSDSTPAARAAGVSQRYTGLMAVERDFRTMKTGLLELRPIFLRKAARTEGHVLVTMLALKMVHALDRRVAPSFSPSKTRWRACTACARSASARRLLPCGDCPTPTRRRSRKSSLC